MRMCEDSSLRSGRAPSSGEASGLGSGSGLTWKVPEGRGGLSISLWEACPQDSEGRSKEERSMPPVLT